MKFRPAPVHLAIRQLLPIFAAIWLVALSDSSPPAAYAASKATRAQGAALFHEKGCEHCHGFDGIGTERAPSLSRVGRMLHKPEIARQIHDGGKQMPAFGDALTDDEIKRLVDFLAAKKRRSP